MKNWLKEAAIIALGLFLLGICIRNGINDFKDKDRVVSVKGLAELEVPANKVIWPLMFKDLGNDLPTLYDNIKAKNNTIVNFLKLKGITEKEISISAPEIIDMQAERYADKPAPFRYNITSVITVTSDKVNKVRSLITEQSELLKTRNSPYRR